MNSKCFVIILILAIAFAGCNEVAEMNLDDDTNGEEIFGQYVVEPCNASVITDSQIIPCIKSAELTESDKAILDKYAGKHTAFAIDTKELADFAKSKEGETFQLQLQIDEKLQWTIDLTLYDRHAPEFNSPDGIYSFGSPYFGLETYMGITSDGKKVRLGIDDESFIGVILDDAGRYIIKHISDYIQNNVDNSFIVYHDGYEVFWEDYPPEYIPSSTFSIGPYIRPLSFIEAVSRYLYNDSVYIVKGIALDSYEYGRRVRFVEDLKGNFPENIDEFIVWGGWGPGYPYLQTARSDDLTEYHNQDVLIMLFTTQDHNLAKVANMIYTPSGITWFEMPEDYRTISRTFCILKLSDDKVTGRFIYLWDEVYYDFDKEEWNMNSVPWNEFHEILQEVLNTRK